jgi:SRSO17 transposase
VRMTRNQLRVLDGELKAYLSTMVAEMGRPERREAMGLYLRGLLLDGERKSTQPMAARLAKDDADAEALRQRLQQCVSVSAWSDAEMFRRLALKFEAELPSVEAFVVDDTGFAKKGEHSVGVARQYSGTLGRVDNCQVAVSLHLAGSKGSGCIDFRLYLPEEEWAGDKKRRKTAGVPADIKFQTKWQISLGQIDAARAAGVRPHVVLGDAGYGDATEYRCGLEERSLSYVLGVSSVPTVWRPGVIPAIPNSPRVGRPSTRPAAEESAVSLGDFARELRPKDFRTVTWRQGSKGPIKGRFCAFPVYSAERHTKKTRPALKPLWLIIEDTGEEKRPFKFFFSNLPADTSLTRLVSLIKLRWRVERDYQEMKGELGLDHFEGRTWRGFHHHAALCAVAHGFLALRRALSPPEHSLDLGPGPSSSSAPAHPQHRPLPPLFDAHRPRLHPQGSLQNVIR